MWEKESESRAKPHKESKPGGWASEDVTSASVRWGRRDEMPQAEGREQQKRISSQF